MLAYIEQVYLVAYPKRQTAKNVKYPPPFGEAGNLSEVKINSGC